jgi:hypothetical protein
MIDAGVVSDPEIALENQRSGGMAETGSDGAAGAR